MNSVDKDTNAVDVTGASGVEESAADLSGQPGDTDVVGAEGEDGSVRPEAEAVEASVEPALETESAPASDEAGDPEASSVSPLEEELEALRDRFVRQAAEFQNYRRRTEQEKARMMEFGKASVVQQLLDVVDDFERSLEAARAFVEEADNDGAAQAFSALRDGVGLVYLKLRDALARAGVEEMDAVGKPFDEHEHEAMMQQPVAEGQEPGMVVGEILKGYRMGDRVLRHARVIVSA